MQFYFSEKVLHFIFVLDLNFLFVKFKFAIFITKQSKKTFGAIWFLVPHQLRFIFQQNNKVKNKIVSVCRCQRALSLRIVFADANQQ